MLGGGIESLPDGASVVHIGDGLSFVMPWREFRPTPSQSARIEMAACMGMLGLALDDGQLTAERQRLLSEVETEMAKEARRRSKIPEGRALHVPRHLYADEGPIHLVPARALNLPVIHTDEGRVYAPDSYRAKPSAPAPVMDKFDRVSPIPPEDVRLNPDRMTESQRHRLKTAGQKLASAERRKAARSHMLLGRIRYGRMTPAEKAERLYAKEVMDQLQQEALAANDRAEVSRGRVETLALEEMRGGEMAIYSDGRLSRKNGLDTLLASGGITGPEHVAGEKYADIFSAAKSGEIRIANWEGSGGGSAPDPDGERLRRLKELAAKKALTDIEQFIVRAVSHKRALWVVRLVAGEGRLIAHVSTSGGNRATNTKALQMVLQALADNWGLQ